jgi:hypothetical protein
MSADFLLKTIFCTKKVEPDHAWEFIMWLITSTWQIRL